jgi:tetratricopeptide (TPR) repeat protein
MGVDSLRGGSAGWRVVEPPSWCRDELGVLMELVPERPLWLSGGPPRELEEALGLELWRAVANVRQWADTPPAERETLFARARARRAAEQPNDVSEPGSAPDERNFPAALTPAIASFDHLRNEPGRIAASEIIAGCRAVVAWAESEGFAETAMQFAEAAASVAPESAALANLAGRICRAYGKRGRAELWYDRAIGLARRTPGSRGAREYIHAHLGFATTLLEISEHAAALEHIKRAALTAKRKGMKAKAAEAFHDAMYLATVDGKLGRAAVYARRAVAIYPYHHPRYPALAHDFSLLLVYKGMYSLALRIASGALPLLSARADEVVAWGTVARSAAGARRIRRFTAAVARVDALAPSFGQAGAAALYSVAEAARLLGDWRMAERYATAAVRQAEAAGSIQVADLGNDLLKAIYSRTPGLPEQSKHDPSGALLRRIAPTLRLRLQNWRGPTWRPRRVGPAESNEDQ